MTQDFIDSKKRRGFTLVEIMIVVVIIGLLAVMAMPAFRRVRISSQNSRFINDVRQFRGAIDAFILKEGEYPLDGSSGELPEALADYINEGDFVGGSSIGGLWDIETNDNGVTCAVGVSGYEVSTEQLLMIDEQIDDGDIATGKLRRIQPERFYWVLVE